MTLEQEVINHKITLELDTEAVKSTIEELLDQIDEAYPGEDNAYKARCIVIMLGLKYQTKASFRKTLEIVMLGWENGFLGKGKKDV